MNLLVRHHIVNNSTNIFLARYYRKLIHLPTRISGNSRSILDNIYTNHPLHDENGVMLLLSTHSSLPIGGSPLLLSYGGSPPASPASHLAGLLRRREIYNIMPPKPQLAINHRAALSLFHR